MIRPYKIKKDSLGFTIVEVMMVLAIAGLILVVVFKAVPQLQRSQRDNVRRDIAGRIKSELELSAADNTGTYPFAGVTSTWQNCATMVSASQNCRYWYDNYIVGGNVNLTDPSSGSIVAINYGNNNNASSNPTLSPWTPGTTYISVGELCSGGSLAAGPSTGSATSKQYAVLVALDISGIWFCVDSR